jgi:hypothetical protein
MAGRAMSPPLRRLPYYWPEAARNVLAGALPFLLAFLVGLLGVWLVLLPITR